MAQGSPANGKRKSCRLSVDLAWRRWCQARQRICLTKAEFGKIYQLLADTQASFRAIGRKCRCSAHLVKNINRVARIRSSEQVREIGNSSLIRRKAREKSSYHQLLKVADPALFTLARQLLCGKTVLIPNGSRVRVFNGKRLSIRGIARVLGVSHGVILRINGEYHDRCPAQVKRWAKASRQPVPTEITEKQLRYLCWQIDSSGHFLYPISDLEEISGMSPDKFRRWRKHQAARLRQDFTGRWTHRSSLMRYNHKQFAKPIRSSKERLMAVEKIHLGS